MIRFKTTDDKLKDLGFKIMEDSKVCTTYERYNRQFNYTQKVDVALKKEAKGMVISYDVSHEHLNDIYYDSVGLTYKEMVLFTKKLKEKIRDYKRKG